MYDLAVVTVCGMLKNVQRERNSLRNELAAARKKTAPAVRNEGAARSREAEAVTSCDNVRTDLT